MSRPFHRDFQEFVVTFAASAVTGAPPIPFQGKAMLDIYTPANWTAATVYPYSAPGINGPFVLKNDHAATAVAISAATASQCFAAPAELCGSGAVQLVRSTSHTAQSFAVTVTVKM